MTAFAASFKKKCSRFWYILLPLPNGVHNKRESHPLHLKTNQYLMKNLT